MAESQTSSTATPPAVDETYAATAFRLSPRQWLAAAPFIVGLLVVVPLVWNRVERFEPADDYRVPREQGNDYWTWQRWAERATGQGKVLLLGDSVIWGETVEPQDALAAQLNAVAAERGADVRFANLGLPGGYPAAMPGLLTDYGGAIRGRVLLHCNLRWLVSRRSDLLEADPRGRLNHPRLLSPWPGDVPAWDKPLLRRVNVAVGRKIGFVRWSRHLQDACFLGNAPQWTLDHPYENPFVRITLRMPPPKAGRSERRADGAPEPIVRAAYPWVPLEQSVQWRHFRRSVVILRERGCRLVVCIGPISPQRLTAAALARYRAIEDAAVQWLAAEGVPCLRPEPMAGGNYDDLSHPNADGYRALAERLWSAAAPAAMLDGGARRARPSSERLEDIPAE